MTKPLCDLLLDLDELNREIHRARYKEISFDTMAARFPQASVATRRRMQALLSAPPQRRGITVLDHRVRLFEGVRNLAKAWGGVCETPAYQGRYVPFVPPGTASPCPCIDPAPELVPSRSGDFRRR